VTREDHAADQCEDVKGRQGSILDDAFGLEAAQLRVVLQLVASEPRADRRLRLAQCRGGQEMAAPQRPHVAGPCVDGKIAEAAVRRRLADGVKDYKGSIMAVVIEESQTRCRAVVSFRGETLRGWYVDLPWNLRFASGTVTRDRQAGDQCEGMEG
jgi:hypothetical protein